MADMITRRYTIEMERLPKEFHGCRLLFLSDMHGSFSAWESGLFFERVEAEKPDYILMGGDMIVGGLEPWQRKQSKIQEAMEITCGLAKKYPVYHAYGNHEEKLPFSLLTEYRNRLEDVGVRFLVNEQVALKRDKHHILLYGLSLGQEWYPKWHRKSFSLEGMEKKIGQASYEKSSTFGNLADGCRILMSHNPNYFPAYEAWGADLVLAGHLHGGMMRLPLLGGVIGSDFLLFPFYAGGLYFRDDAGKVHRKIQECWKRKQKKGESITCSERGTRMIVSCGLGAHAVEFRLFNPSELTSIELRRSELENKKRGQWE